MDISVDCVVFGYDEENFKLMVLLIEQEQLSEDIPPYKALPGDLVLHDENLDDAANRVLFELTGLKGLYLKQFYAFGDPNRVKAHKDQLWLKRIRKDPETRVVTVGYYSLVKMEDFDPKPSSFAKKVEWTSIDEIPSLAFDHNDVFTKGLKALRKDMEMENVGFELLPNKFTISQLQKLFELILNKEFDKRNFRKSVKKMDEIVPLKEKQKGVVHKPAQYYSFEKGDK